MRALERALSDLQRRAVFGMDLGLLRTVRSLTRLGNPERQFHAVHIAGTNGKGSVSAMVAAIASCAGISVGLYTSPHLQRWNERIQIGGAPIQDALFCEALERALGTDDRLTFFESLTVAAFWAFAQSGVELAVIEAGLGGRLDATNVLESPRVTAITSIGLDHTAVLGPTGRDIAREKAGIFKPNCPVVLGPVSPECERVLEEAARHVGAGPVWRVKDAHGRGEGDQVIRARWTGRSEVAISSNAFPAVRARLNLLGSYQLANAAVATGIAHILSEHFPSVFGQTALGLANTHWPGRYEEIPLGNARALLDAAHNPDGIEALVRALAEDQVAADKTVLLFGALNDKDWKPMLERLAPLARERIYAEPKGRAAAPLSALNNIAQGNAFASAKDALAFAGSRLRGSDTLLITGSIYLIGEVRALLKGEPQDPVLGL